MKLENMNHMTHLTIRAGHNRVNRTKRKAGVRVDPTEGRGEIHL